jgi:hypothetical protein
MPKPADTTRSAATRQIRPPPLSQHLREFASRPDAWVVLARNMIPVVGIYAFGWSVAVAVFNYWFDGLTALAAIVAAIIPRAMRETQSKRDHATLTGNVVRGVFVWLVLVVVVGLPYWIVLIPLHDLLLSRELRRQLAQSPALWFTFGSIAASHFWKAFRMGVRHDAGPGAKTAGAVGSLSPDPARSRDVFHGRAWTLLHSGAADGGAIELSGPSARSARFSAIRRASGNTIRAIPHQSGDFPDVPDAHSLRFLVAIASQVSNPFWH